VGLGGGVEEKREGDRPDTPVRVGGGFVQKDPERTSDNKWQGQSGAMMLRG